MPALSATSSVVTFSKPRSVNRSRAARSTRARVPSVGAPAGAVSVSVTGPSCPGLACWHWVSLASRHPFVTPITWSPHARDPRRRRDHGRSRPRRGGGPGRGVARRGGLDRRHVRRLLSPALPVNAVVEFDAALPWRRARSVALRPEPFG